MKPATVVHQQHRPSIRQLSIPLSASGLLPRISLLLILTVLVWVGWQQLATPNVVPASAPATEFSGERAMEHLRVIAAEPRVGGSPGYLAAQEYLVEQLRGFGLEPEIQTTTVLAPGEAGAEGFAAATVHNIIARLPGTANTGAIALNAHYDSGSTGPGAMDAGSGVVTVLETVRALQAGAALRNDLIIVFADAEEVGMLGAQAFNEQHPWASDIRLTLNYEGAGGSGPALLYATSPADNWLVAEYLKVAPDPSASSMFTEIVDLYSAGRLDCDLGEYTDRGSAGLGFVVLGDTPVYHTKLDNPDQIDPGSIQQEGSNTLAAVRHFGNLDLSSMPDSGDRVFFNIWPGILVHYPASLVIPLATVVTAAIAGLFVTGLRRGALTRHGLIAGTLASLAITMGTVVVTTLLWFVIRMLNTDYQVMLIGSYQAGFFVVALSIATVALIATGYALLSRRVRAQNLMAGWLLGSLLPLWFASLLVPGMSYLVVWPLLFGILPLGWTLLAQGRATSIWMRTAILAVAAIPALVILPGTLHGMLGLVNRLEGLTGIGLLGVLMLFVAPLAGLLLPHLQFIASEPASSRSRRWAIPVVAGVVAISLLAWGIATSGFDAEHPRPNQIAYQLNADTGEAQWVSIDRHLDRWTGQFFPTGAERTEYESVLLGTLPAFIAPAPVATVPPPAVSVLSNTTTGDVRTLELRLTSPGGARLMVADIQAPGELVTLNVNGQPVDLNDHEWARAGMFPVIYHNPPAEGWTLSMTVRATEPVIITVEETMDGLPDVPGMTIQPRPAEMMPAPGYASDPTIVSKEFAF